MIKFLARLSVFSVLFLLLFPSIQAQDRKSSRKPAEQPTTEFGSSLEQYGKRPKRKPVKQGRSEQPSSDETIRVETDLVVVDFLVSNEKGNIIKGLTKNDFVVSEDGKEQTVELFSSGSSDEVPRSIVLIIDNSGGQAPYAKESIAAAKLLVEQIGGNDRMAIVTGDRKLRIGFTGDKAALYRALDSIDWGWVWNAEYDSLLAVLNELFEESSGQRIVVFQGDGTHAMWMKRDKEHPYPVSYSTLMNNGMRYTGISSISKYGFADVREAIERSRATIYPVIVGWRVLGLSRKVQNENTIASMRTFSRFYGLRDESDMPPVIRKLGHSKLEASLSGQKTMFRVAELSGGLADFIETPDDAKAVYSNIFTVMENRYAIGYHPSNQVKDGRRREIRISVKDRPDFIVTARTHYFFE